MRLAAPIAAILVVAGVPAMATARTAVPPPVVEQLAMARAVSDLSAQIQLAGRGTVLLRGRLALSGNLATRSVMSVTDRAGDAQVHVGGATIPLNRRGRIANRRVVGILFVTGSDLTVQINGRGVSISAAGSGAVRLTGSGRYRLNLGAERAWPRATIQLRPGSTPAAARRSIVR